MTCCTAKRLLSLILAGVFFLSMIPYPAAAEDPPEPVFRRIFAPEELISGEYLLVAEDGRCPSILADGRLTAAAATVDTASGTAASEAVWTLTVDHNIMLTDSNGTTVVPGETDGSLAPGEGSWQVRSKDGWFSFHSVRGEQTVILAGITGEEAAFGAFREADIAAEPERYICRFALYRRAVSDAPSGGETPPSTAEESEDFWYPVALEEIAPEDTVAVTATREDGIFAFSSDAAFPAVPVQTEQGMLRSRGADLHWCIERSDGGLYLRCGSGLLAESEDGSLCVTEAGTLWSVEAGQLKSLSSGRFLQLAGNVWQTGETGTQLHFRRLGAPPPEGNYGFYFGLLHAHTDLSDGTGSVTDAFDHASKVPGLDFFAVTDHSNSFDNAENGSILTDGTAVSKEWAAGKAAAAAVTDSTFVGIFGYEMTWQEGRHLGHISTFHTPGWQSREQEGFSTLAAYYQVLLTCPESVSQFNHPGEFYGDFNRFSGWTPEYDRAVQLLEVGGEGDLTAYDAYTMALDAGWHVAPTNSQNNHNGSWGDASPVRTVVLAESLTEQGLFTAMHRRRVYATEDADLQIDYRLNGQIMGSVLAPAEQAEIQIWIYDPTDASVGRVEVITEGGAVAASAESSQNCVSVNLTLSGEYRYYYLRITQSDGDIAVTAPVWLEQPEDLAIAGFTADTAVPVQGQPLTLSLEIENETAADFVLERICLSVDGQSVHTAEAPGTAESRETFRWEHTYTHPAAGAAVLQITVTGNHGSEPKTLEATLPLSFRAPQMTGGILVDTGHGNTGADRLNHFTAIASRVHMPVVPFSGPVPEGGKILVIFAPETPFSQKFVEEVIAFLDAGGSLILCGREGRVLELNRLLITAGSTLRLTDEPVRDAVNSGDTPQDLFLTEYNPDAPLCRDIPGGSFYCHRGIRVEPGDGQWLVRRAATGEDAAVVLACEQTRAGGMILVAGDGFLADSRMPVPENLWDPPRINQRIVENLLNAERTQLPLIPIGDLRKAQPEQIYRIGGYVTAGTSNPYNTFSDRIYVQDDTGGIAVTGFREAGIPVGAPMDIVGRLNTDGSEPVLELIAWESPNIPHYRYVPRTGFLSDTLRYEDRGGELMQVESKVAYTVPTADGKGLSRIILIDSWGDVAYIHIDPEIRSGACGTNLLAREIKPGRTVRCLGILCRDSDGTCYLRVRNCDEVVYVPPGYNPPTADTIRYPIAAMALSASLLAVLLRRKRRR